MGCLDFTEIPAASAGPGRDAFELFARELLVAKGFKIDEEPDRGADGGRDLIVLEDRPGVLGSTTMRWLVSCKHTIHSGNAVSPKEESNVRDRLETHRCQGFLAFYSHVPTSGLGSILRALRGRFEYVQYDRERIERELLCDPAAHPVAERFMPNSFARWLERVPPLLATQSTGDLHPLRVADAPQRLHLSVKSINHRRRCADLRMDEEMPQGSVVEYFDVLPTLHFGTMEYDVKGMNVVVGLKRALCHVMSDHGTVEVALSRRNGIDPAEPVYNAGDVWEFVDPAAGLLKGYALGREALCRIRTRPGLPAHAKIELTVARSDIECSFSPPQATSQATQKVMKRFLEKAAFQGVSDHLLLSSIEMTSK